MQVEESASSSSRTHDLEKEVKEKNLLIGKLRHEAVIINEHLLEALRRLRRSSSETNVDRRLVTNVLLQYITTPRGYSKRFEMLQLLATILSWGDAERGRAGLQRDPGGGSGVPSGILRSTSGQGQELEKTDETEVMRVYPCAGRKLTVLSSRSPSYGSSSSSRRPGPRPRPTLPKRLRERVCRSPACPHPPPGRHQHKPSPRAAAAAVHGSASRPSGLTSTSRGHPRSRSPIQTEEKSGKDTVPDPRSLRMEFAYLMSLHAVHVSGVARANACISRRVDRQV